MVNEIFKIAQANPYGFTYNLKTKRAVKYGYCVAYKETQNCFGKAGLLKALEHSLQHEQIIGGWLNSENNFYYFDSVKIFKSKNEALKFARENEQIAIFDLTNLIEITL
uniref:hypothetical protein n=1 Tax=uncultured Draconibacterium sp. TaxID=1573823 RepID=UPI0032167C8C